MALSLDKKETLSGLITYTQKLAELRTKCIYDIRKLGGFYLDESFLLNTSDVKESHDINTDIWLSVPRLAEIPPPSVENELLKSWISIYPHPLQEPFLNESIPLTQLSDDEVHVENHEVDINELIYLKNYDKNDLVQDLFSSYLVKWRKWALTEKRRRNTITLYINLYTLYSRMKGELSGDGNLELILGRGIATIEKGETLFSPILTHVINLSINKKHALELSISKTKESLLELDPLRSLFDVSNVNILLASYDRERDNINILEKDKYSRILSTAAGVLDANGRFYNRNDSSSPQIYQTSLRIPEVKPELQITDSWVLYASPPSSHALLNDLKAFEEKLAATKIESDCLEMFLGQPSDKQEKVGWSSFRGRYPVDGWDSVDKDEKKDLFFPKPYNDEQVKIVQLLDKYPGTIVQGPPGTGKTHTIANIICHYLALGKKVLVTSQKHHALQVLRDKLPVEVQPYCVTNLGNEKSDKTLLEQAISKIQEILSSSKQHLIETKIINDENRINSLHVELVHVDRDISKIARLYEGGAPLKVRGSSVLSLEEAARLIMSNHETAKFVENIDELDEYEPQLLDEDVQKLRAARLRLGAHIVYFPAYKNKDFSIEPPVNETILEIHDALVTRHQIGTLIHLLPLSKNVTLPMLKETNERCAIFIDNCEQRNDIWLRLLFGSYRAEELEELYLFADTLLQRYNLEYQELKYNNIKIPEKCIEDAAIEPALSKCVQGKKPFLFFGPQKTKLKPLLDAIKLNGYSPASKEDWNIVYREYLLLKSLHKESYRWNQLKLSQLCPFVLEINKNKDLIEWAREIDHIRTQRIRLRDLTSSLDTIFSDWRTTDLYPLSLENIKKLHQDHLLLHQKRLSLLKFIALKECLLIALKSCQLPILQDMYAFIDESLGNHNYSCEDILSKWKLLVTHFEEVLSLSDSFQELFNIAIKIRQSGGDSWAVKLETEPVTSHDVDMLTPSDWRERWQLSRLMGYFNKIYSPHKFLNLANKRLELEEKLGIAYEQQTVSRIQLALIKNSSPKVKVALDAFIKTIKSMGKGTSKYMGIYRKDLKNNSEIALPAVPCWIMPHSKIVESLPNAFACFDLVIIDEASQSDYSAIPAILRAKKLLVVGDDKQVSPDNIGMVIDNSKSLAVTYLSKLYPAFRQGFSFTGYSMYSIFSTVFAAHNVMLKEHFRCAGPIIEYSKREFYNHELKPLRAPKASERLDPPLIDILVEDGLRKGNENVNEIKIIVHEIYKIVQNPLMKHRSIGVISLLSSGKQAEKIYDQLFLYLGPDIMKRHDISCGSALEFQGKERDIIFLSMVVSPKVASSETEDDRSSKKIGAMSNEQFARRLNVAGSRAKDRMYLVRSVERDELGTTDLRRGLIDHFASPYNSTQTEAGKTDSPFEEEVYQALIERNYRVIPQVTVGQYRIDLVVEGENDRRRAIECDGDRYHHGAKWEKDMQRQRILERAGWKFWRCFASEWVLHREDKLKELLNILEQDKIFPIKQDMCFKDCLHTQHRRVFADDLVPIKPLISEPDERPIRTGTLQKNRILPTASTVLLTPTTAVSEPLTQNDRSKPIGDKVLKRKTSLPYLKSTRPVLTKHPIAYDASVSGIKGRLNNTQIPLAPPSIAGLAYIENLKKAAEQGDSHKQYEVGEYYAKGDPLHEDWEKALPWYIKSANLGYCKAQYQLAVCFASGLGIGEDERQAFAYYKKASDQGHEASKCKLAECYFYGIGVNENQEIAVKLWTELSYKKNKDACDWLAICYLYGYGVEQDPKKATYYKQYL